MVNMTCPTIPDKPADPKPFFENGQIDFKAHDVGWLVCGIMALIATISSVWLIWKHLTYYTCPQQQRHIVRLLVMVPIYAIVSFMSYLFYQEALYYQTIRDCYEAVLVTSFFYLILAYTGYTRAEQHAVFRNIDTKGRFWFWPLGSWKYRPEGLHFLWLMKICVLQYAIIRPLCTFVAVGTEYFGYYCLHSWMPWFTHVWCAFFISVSVTVAMYCLIQLYMPVRKLVDPYKPVLKFLAIKTIVFLTFWQDTLLSFLVSFNAIKETEYFTAEQIQAGINALLQCFWMLLFGFIHIKAFSYLPYRPQDRSRTTLRGKAMLDVLDFRDWFVEMKESTRYIAARSKGRNYTLAEDLRAKRHEHLLNALGKQRTANLDAEMDMEKAAMPTFWKNPEDAQFWTPGDESDSDLSGKHANGEGRSSTPLDKAGSDSHTALPNADSRAKVRSELVEQSNTMASRDSHASRAAELQRLVAELDLQDVDQSIVGAEDHDYGYEDERYERAALMHSRHSQPSPGKSGDTPTKELDVHPELTQYHTPTIQLANVPSLTYDQETSSGSVRRGQDLSAVAEEEEDEGSHVRHGSKVGAGIGAFGIAAWLGWNSSVHEAQPKPQPQQQQQQVNAGGGVANDYLRPGDSYAGQQYGADRSPDVDGTGWWRNYWDRVSNAGSREPSIAGMEDEKEPLQTARPAVMRQVTAGSWGLDSVQPVNQQRALPAPPTLKIETNAAHHNDTRGGDGSVDSATSPRISPHVDSPLSRLIQTSRDSFSSLSRDEVREQLLASPSKGTALSGSSISVRKGSLPAVQAVAATRPAVAPRNPSVAPSSNQASVSRVTSTTTRSGPAAPAATKSSTAPSASAYESAVQEMLSSTDTASSKHPIVFVDALLPGEPAAEPATTLAAAVEKTKALPPAVGPKGKLFNLVLPSPLSPARYPYGQEGPTVPSSADQDVTSPVSRREASGHAARQPSESADPRGGGTLKWASQPARPPKPSESVDRASAKLPSGKGIITVGGMSLVQAKAAAQAAAEAEAEAEAQRTIRMEKQEKAAVVGPTKSILSRPTEESKAEGKLVLPAPSQLASVEREDPYAAVASHAPGASGGGSKLARVGRPGGSVVTSSTMQTRTSISGTSFEVGHIVPRDAVVRASLPSQGVAGVPLKSYYDSIRGSQGRGSQGGRQSGGQQRHSYAPSVRPGMLPAHPSQLAAQSPQYHQQRIQQQQPWAAQHPPPPSFASAPTPAGSSFFRPAGPPHEPHVPRSQQLFHHHHYYHHHHQQQQQQQQQWTTPNHHTNSSSVRPQYPQAGQPRGQFQFEYYND